MRAYDYVEFRHGYATEAPRFVTHWRETKIITELHEEWGVAS